VSLITTEVLGGKLLLVCRLIYADDGDDMFLRNVGSYRGQTASGPRRQHSS
jgi:hypothetical protein